MSEKRFIPICPNCYWFDGYRCEITHQEPIETCIEYLNDTIHSKRVKRWIEKDPKKARVNWNMLDEVDRRKFIEIYGEDDFMNDQQSIIQFLKEEKDYLVRVIDENIKALEELKEE